MVLNILCNTVVFCREEEQYCMSFIDDTCGKFFSVKLWPALWFLNNWVENKDSQILYCCLVDRGLMDPKHHFWENWDSFQWLIIKGQILPKKRAIYMGRSKLLSNILILKNIKKHGLGPLDLLPQPYLPVNRRLNKWKAWHLCFIILKLLTVI